MRDAVLSERLAGFRRVVITGASSGIGEAIAREMFDRVPDVQVCALSRSAPAAFEDRTNLRFVPCDLTDEASTRNGLEALRAWLDAGPREGRLLLVNNSGFGSYGPFPSPSPERHLAMIELNVRAPVRLAAALADDLEASRGAVMNIASVAGFQSTPFMATYGATKAFLLEWSLALAQDWRPRGVTVLAVCPGPTSSAFFKAAGFASAPIAGKGGGQTSGQVARESLVALARQRTLVVCGWKNKLLTAVSARVPKVLGARLTACVLRRMRLERFQQA